MRLPVVSSTKDVHGASQFRQDFVERVNFLRSKVGFALPIGEACPAAIHAATPVDSGVPAGARRGASFCSMRSRTMVRECHSPLTLCPERLPGADMPMSAGGGLLSNCFRRLMELPTIA